MILLNLAWFGTLPSFWEYLSFTQARGDYPANGDSIGIPMFGGLIMLVILAPIVNLGAYELLKRARLGGTLLIPVKGGRLNVVISMSCGIFSLSSLCVWADLYYEASRAAWLMLPSILLSLYLAWSMRAGLLEKAGSM